MPRPDRSEERRDQILEAAIQAFAEKGLHEARMEDIASRAGLSKPALYLYFRNKDAIIGSLLRFFFDREMRSVRKLQEASGTTRSRLEALGDQFGRSIEHMQMAMPLLLEFYRSSRPRTQRAEISHRSLSGSTQCPDGSAGTGSGRRRVSTLGCLECRPYPDCSLRRCGPHLGNDPAGDQCAATDTRWTGSCAGWLVARIR